MAEINPTLTAEEYESLTDEDVKALYKQKDDGYIVDIKGVLSAKDATKRKYEAEKAEREALASKYESLKVFEGKDPELVETALKTLTKAEEKKLIDKGEFEKIRLKDKEDFDNKYKTDIAAKESEISKFRTVLETQVTQKDVLAELINQGVIREKNAPQKAVQLFMPYVKTEITDDMKFKMKIVDDSGYDTGKTLQEAVAEFKEDNPFLFTGNLAGGSPDTPDGTRGGKGARKWADLGQREKSNAISQYGSVEEAKKHYS